mmetsp:Transcript_61690/g.165199  ORF Transcript_61690/g.165199 Transcript_61690/m.165199 type:complete len:200 (+) Transcript_61690:245-844(+)
MAVAVQSDRGTAADDGSSRVVLRREPRVGGEGRATTTLRSNGEDSLAEELPRADNGLVRLVELPSDGDEKRVDPLSLPAQLPGTLTATGGAVRSVASVDGMCNFLTGLRSHALRSVSSSGPCNTAAQRPGGDSELARGSAWRVSRSSSANKRPRGVCRIFFPFLGSTGPGVRGAGADPGGPAARVRGGSLLTYRSSSAG